MTDPFSGYQRRPLERLADELGYGPAPIEDPILIWLGVEIGRLSGPHRAVIETLCGLLPGTVEMSDSAAAGKLGIPLDRLEHVFNAFSRHRRLQAPPCPRCCGGRP